MRSARITLLALLYLCCAAVRMDADEIQVQSVTVGAPIPVADNIGDTWDPAWAKDGSIYTPSCDTNGFAGKGSGNIAMNRVSGDQPDHLTGETVNYMTADYGATSRPMPDGSTWKSGGCLAYNDALYWVVSRHVYGGQQAARDATIIKSIDGGKTWTPSEKENYEHPMFPGSGFATPYFVKYGQEGKEAVVDQSDKYIYALSNNGFWENGDFMILGRVPRSKIANLSAADWQFFTHGDGTQDAAWSSAAKDAVPVLANKNHLGMTGATYLPAQKCYLMVGWYYPAGGGKMTSEACKTTTWDFYTAAYPWGPWKNVGSHTWTPQGFYSPEICSKFTSPDGSKIWAFTAGNWNDYSVYRLTLVPLTLN